jgi:hypothetical protein
MYSQAYVYLHHPGIDASYSLINPLPNLYNNGNLQGTYVNILNDESDRAYNASNDFTYSTSSTHFDEANLYYHIDRIASYFHNLGFNSFTQITAHAHHDFFYEGDPMPNAGYFPGDHHLRFSDGQGVTGFNSFAREDKIIYHEYTHAVSDYIADLESDFYQYGAVCEGLSDYFAASFTGRTTIGEYALAGFDEERMNLSNPRISNFVQYNNDDYYWVEGEYWGYHEPHLGGEFWSACLWDLRNSLTSAVADEIIYDALGDIYPDVTFLQYRQAIIDKDISNNGGCNVNTIKHLFYLRGIGNDAGSITLSGTLTNTETWYCTNTLQGNVFVPSGVTLYIPSYATVNLNNFSIISTGGTISVDEESLIGLRATLANMAVPKAYCGSIQTAVNYAEEFNEILLENGNFNENVTISNADHLIISGSSIPEYTQLGNLTVNNCYDFEASEIGAKHIYINYGDITLLYYLYAAGTNQSGAGLTLYYSDGIDVDNLYAEYLNTGVDSYTSEADIEWSRIEDDIYGIKSWNASNIDVDNSLFCGTATDLFAYNFSSIYATSCAYDNGVPSISSSGGSTVQSLYNENCSNLSKSASENAYFDETINGDPAESEFRKINKAYFSINKKFLEDKKNKTEGNRETYCTDYQNVINDFEQFIKNNPDSPLSKIALVTTARSYKRIDNLRGKKDAGSMKDFLTGIINNKEYPALQQTAERLMIDYYRLATDYSGAIKVADELMEKYKEDKDYICDVNYAKGLILSHNMNNRKQRKNVLCQL